MNYYIINKDLYHASAGYQRKNHKYIRRTGSPGHYSYVYDNGSTGSNNANAFEEAKKRHQAFEDKWNKDLSELFPESETEDIRRSHNENVKNLNAFWEKGKKNMEQFERDSNADVTLFTARTPLGLVNDWKSIATNPTTSPKLRKEAAKIHVRQNAGKNTSSLDIGKRISKSISSDTNLGADTRKTAAKVNVELNKPRSFIQKIRDKTADTLIKGVAPITKDILDKMKNKVLF